MQGFSGSVLSRRLWGQGLCVAITLLLCGATVSAQPKIQGEFEGAIWRFSLKPKTGNGEEVRGRFRVAGKTVYQMATPEDKEFTKVVGQFVRKGKTRSQIEFTDLRFLRKGGIPQNGNKGNALLDYNQFGEWSGSFIDDSGQHWIMKCSRVQE